MKKIFVSLLVFIAVSPLFADMHFDAKIWRGLQTYDVRTLNKNIDAHVNELVAVHFNFRGKDIHHLKPGWYESSIWQPDPEGRKGFSEVRVMVSKDDLKIFKSLPTDSSSGAEITVYGRVRRDADAKFVFVRLIGRNTTVDANGKVTVSW